MTDQLSIETGRDTDADDLVALRNGDRAAAERLVREHASWMLALARPMVRDEMLAEDIVQNAFARIFQKLDQFEGRSALKTWMHRIVVSQALMVLRKERRSREDPIEQLLPGYYDNGCRIEDDWGNCETPESLIQKSQVSAKVVELVGALPDTYRIVLLLRDIEEMSTQEVADLLGISENNVKVRLHRARAALKKLLEPLMKGQVL